MAEERQKRYERQLGEGKTLPAPKDNSDRQDQDKAKQTHNGKKQ